MDDCIALITAYFGYWRPLGINRKKQACSNYQDNIEECTVGHLNIPFEMSEEKENLVRTKPLTALSLPKKTADMVCT
jgi:hypothetical protein